MLSPHSTLLTQPMCPAATPQALGLLRNILTERPKHARAAWHTWAAFCSRGLNTSTPGGRGRPPALLPVPMPALAPWSAPASARPAGAGSEPGGREWDEAASRAKGRCRGGCGSWVDLCETPSGCAGRAKGRGTGVGGRGDGC